MPFSNPIVSGDGTLVVNQIKSTNYVAHTSGWFLGKDGTADITNAVASDDFLVYSGTGNLYYSVSNALTAVREAVDTDSLWTGGNQTINVLGSNVPIAFDSNILVPPSAVNNGIVYGYARLSVDWSYDTAPGGLALMLNMRPYAGGTYAFQTLRGTNTQTTAFLNVPTIGTRLTSVYEWGPFISTTGYDFQPTARLTGAGGGSFTIRGTGTYFSFHPEPYIDTIVHT